MKLKAALLSTVLALAMAQAGAPAQSLPPGGGTPSTGLPTPPGFLSDTELRAYDETYLGLRSFRGDEIISQFFENAAEGTLN